MVQISKFSNDELHKLNERMINTERLTIRNIIKDDWQSIQKIWEDEKKSKYAQYDKPQNTEHSIFGMTDTKSDIVFTLIIMAKATQEKAYLH